jgi:integrase
VLSAQIARRFTDAGLGDFSLHDLRHAHATYLLQQKMPLKAVSQRLGHADIRVTLGIYTHVMPGDDESLASAINGIL